MRVTLFLSIAACALFASGAFGNNEDCAPPPLPEAVYGLVPLAHDWSEIAFRPDLEPEPPLNARIPIPYGAIEMTFSGESGYHLLIPPGIRIINESSSGIPVNITESPALAQEALSAADWEQLNALGWDARAGAGLAVLVSVPRQMLYLIEGRAIVWQAPCATSKLGTGQVMNSMQTPLGWHRIAEKLGGDAPWGQVFRSRAATAKVWDGTEQIAEGLVLTRILWLEGLEEGRNKGKNSAGEVVDSRQRYIYIHGTNKEHCIGTPMSDGCVNLRNDDVIKLFELVPGGTPVLIAEF